MLDTKKEYIYFYKGYLSITADLIIIGVVRKKTCKQKKKELTPG